MKITKNILEISIQACINSYKGKHGASIPIFEIQKDFDLGKVEWSFGIKNKILYIVFRGSDGKADWIDNFTYNQVPYQHDSKIKLHKGFYEEQYLEIRNKLLYELTDILSSYLIDDIIITGHSLGGALALISTFDIYNLYRKGKAKTISACIAFAPPRQGNSKYVSELKKSEIPLYIFRYKNDTVTEVPPKYITYFNKVKIFNKIPVYYPVILRYKNSGKITRLGDVKWYDRLLNITTNPLDHYPELYKKAIKKYRI